MTSSPFPYHGPLDPVEVVGRRDLRRDLAERIVDRRLTALLGPRRYGKTSVLKRVAADLHDVGPEVVWLDFFELNSMADLAGAIDRGLASTRGPLRNLLETVAGGASLRIGTLGVELSREKRHRPDPVVAARTLVQVLVEAATRRDLFLVIDEFAGVANVKGAAGLLRTELQHHYRTLGIVFAGSQPSTMRMLFEDQEQPFFAQADLIEIGPMSTADVLELVETGFEATQRSAGVVGTRIAGFTAGHPQRSMQLADAAWRRTEPAATADLAVWEAALDDVRRSVDSASERLYELLDPGEQRTLRALASGGSIYGTMADVLDLKPGTASAALGRLRGRGFVHEVDEADALVDPLLADWIRRRFPI